MSLKQISDNRRCLFVSTSDFSSRCRANFVALIFTRVGTFRQSHGTGSFFHSHERTGDGRNVVHHRQTIIHDGRGGTVNHIHISTSANDPQVQADIEHEIQHALELFTSQNQRRSASSPPAPGEQSRP